MSIQSPYTISLTPDGSGAPLTIVAAGGWLESLPTFEAEQGLFESDGSGLGLGFFRPLGGVTVAIQLVLEDDKANLLTALEAFLNADLSGAINLLEISGVLTFTPAVGAATVFGEAVVSIITPGLPAYSTATVTRQISIQTTLPN